MLLILSQKYCTWIRDFIPVWRVELVIACQDLSEQILVMVFIVIVISFIIKRRIAWQPEGRRNILKEYVNVVLSQRLQKVPILCLKQITFLSQLTVCTWWHLSPSSPQAGRIAVYQPPLGLRKNTEGVWMPQQGTTSHSWQCLCCLSVNVFSHPDIPVSHRGLLLVRSPAWQDGSHWWLF